MPASREARNEKYILGTHKLEGIQRVHDRPALNEINDHKCTFPFYNFS